MSTLMCRCTGIVSLAYHTIVWASRRWCGPKYQTGFRLGLCRWGRLSRYRCLFCGHMFSIGSLLHILPILRSFLSPCSSLILPSRFSSSSVSVRSCNQLPDSDRQLQGEGDSNGKDNGKSKGNSQRPAASASLRCQSTPAAQGNSKSKSNGKSNGKSNNRFATNLVGQSSCHEPLEPVRNLT